MSPNLLDRIESPEPRRPTFSLEQNVAWINAEAPEPEGEVFQFKGTQSPPWVLTVIECLCDLSKIELTPVKPELGLPYLAALPSPEVLTLSACWPLPEIPGDSLDVPSWGQHMRSTEFQSPSIPNYRVLCSGLTASQNPLLRVGFESFVALEYPSRTDGDCNYRSGLMSQPRAVRSPEGKMVGGPHEPTRNTDVISCLHVVQSGKKFMCSRICNK